MTGEILPMVLPREEHEARETKGRQIARLMNIKQVGRHYVVPSQTDPAASYIVDLEEERCTCPDFELRHVRCKHQHAVEFTIIWEQTQDADGTVTETVTVQRKTYRQDWAAYNAAQTHEKEHVVRLLQDLCDGIVERVRVGPGRPSKSLRDLTIAAVMKIYSTFSGRRASSDLRELLAKGVLTEEIHYNTIFEFLGKPETIPLLSGLVECSAAALAPIEKAGQFAIDSTGFSVVQYDRWFDQKHGKLHAKHEWIKLHAMCGTVTNAVTAVRISSEADCPVLPDLLAITRKRFDVRELSADKAYLSRKNLEAIEAAGARAFIPLKENTIIGSGSDAWARHFCRMKLQPEEFFAPYHRRSNIETTFHMIKAKFGGAVRAKTPTAQINEVLCKLIAHNLCCLVHAIYELGLEPEFWPESYGSGLMVVR